MTNSKATSENRWLRLTALLCASIPFGIGFSSPVHAQLTPQILPQLKPQVLPLVSLRGYGKLSGVFTPLTSPEGASVLQINCDSIAKAQLVQAKYLSDLGSLAGVKVEADGVRLIDGQGALAAMRTGATVRVVVAPDERTLRGLMASVKGAFPVKGVAPVLEARVEVPMWLDRFDKFSFRHYYRPWEQPQGSDQKYDFLGEFDYAKQQQRAGFVFWDEMLANDTAEGLMNYGWWEWAAGAARQRDLPIGINLSGGEPTWLLNRYREQTQLKMPGFVGNYHDLKSPYLGGTGALSWNATTAEEARLGVLQASVRRFAAYPEVTTFLEPHGELNHGPQDVFLEYGPVADAGYRRFLREKYGSPAKVGQRWKRAIESWDEVRVPELASFAGWNAQALDLGGLWRVGYEELLGPVLSLSAYQFDNHSAPSSKPAPQEWFAPNFDDSSWPCVPAPGNDRQLFLAKRPAVFRRDFDVDAAWKANHPRVWLYVWDLDGATNQEVRAVLNGREVERERVSFNRPHWSAVEVTSALQCGHNALALRLPQGVLSYKTYLSPAPPKQYPDLGTGLNAQWVDFSDFMQWSRVRAVQGGTQMIRQVAPNPQIVLMAPTVYADGVKKVASDYGGEFHDTGFMGAFWADYPASVMRGADLPTTVEPGGPAHSLAEWKKQWGLWQTEGVQGVDYFIHIGDILWNPEIKADYEANRKQISLLGQSHYAKAETAVLYSDRISQLTGYPWGASPNTALGSGYWSWNAASVLRGAFPYDGLTQSSFARGEASPYRVIVDSNTSIMDEAMVSDIERWVRKGGTFITLAQTGRSTPEQPNSWPISRLTGYRVTHIDQLKPDGSVGESGTLQSAPGQKVFDATWNGERANGLHLQKNAPDAQNLLLWNDGSVAAGARSLGKGFVVQLGAKFTGSNLFDRVEPGGDTSEARGLRRTLSTLLNWRGVRPEAARLEQEGDQVWLRPAVTNNGLYDTWTLWNWSGDKAQTVSVVLDKSKTPSFAFDARDGKSLPLVASPEGAKWTVVLQPLETRVFLTPRGQLAQAPLAWFDLQRHWWRGTQTSTKQLPPPTQRFARNLTEGWKFQPLQKTEDATPLLAVKYDDHTWQGRSLGLWNTKETGGQGRGVFRKTFVVPSDWKTGRISLWMTSWFGSSFVGQGRVWLDGREVKGMNEGALIAQNSPSLVSGTSHTLAVEVQSEGVLAGLRGQCWLSFEPTPAQKLDLASGWQPSSDGLHYDAPIALPGHFNAQMLRRQVFIEEGHRSENVVLTVEGSRELVSVLINGHLMRRHHHMIGERWSLNLTPFVKFGAVNEIELVRWENPGPIDAREVSLGFFDPRFYP